MRYFTDYMNRQDKIMVSIIIAILIIVMICVNIQKPLIQEATYNELLEINGIGPILAERVINHIEPDISYNIEKLLEIDGIGPAKLKLIKKKYR